MIKAVTRVIRVKRDYYTSQVMVIMERIPQRAFFGLEDLSVIGTGQRFGNREGPVQSIPLRCKSKFRFLLSLRAFGRTVGTCI
jgi:hypothetical protein